jgi:molecular chaperone GrpE (heat shock protein)
VDDEPSAGALAQIIRSAVRAELDEVLPHVVAALKRHDAVADLSRRLDDAQQRLAEREGRPLIAGLRRVLVHVRRLDFDAQAKDLIVAELERLLVGAGYTEYGEVGEPFDPVRHEAIDGEAESDRAVVLEIFEPGMETLGAVLARARVRVGHDEHDDQIDPEVPAP